VPRHARVRRARYAGDLAVEKHHRHAGVPGKGRELVRAAAGRAEDETVGAAVEQVLDVATFDLGVAAAAREEEAIAERRQDIFGAAHDVREEGTRHVAHHDTHRERLTACQAPGDVVRVEPELGNGALDARARGRRDRELAVDHTRDRLVGDEGAPADVSDGGALLPERDRHSWHPPALVRAL
jgi:hypothetical protein